MLGRNRRSQEIELAERARISRMLRESEAGWLFYGPDGTAFHITADEARRHEHAALRLLTRFLDYQRRIPLRMIGTALLLGGIFALASAVLPRAIMAQAGWMIGPLCFVVVLAQSCGGVIYDWRIRLWQKGLARQLAKSQRGGVAPQIEAKHRRHNLFKSAAQLLCLVVLVRAGFRLHADAHAMIPDLIDISVIAAAYAAHFAGLRVDTTHRRRKWLD